MARHESFAPGGDLDWIFTYDVASQNPDVYEARAEGPENQDGWMFAKVNDTGVSTTGPYRSWQRADFPREKYNWKIESDVLYQDIKLSKLWPQTTPPLNVSTSPVFKRLKPTDNPEGNDF